MRKIIMISVLSIVVLFGLVGCSSGVTQEEYEAVKSQLSDSQTQIAALQESLSESTITEAQYQELNTQYNDLQKQYDAKEDELKNIRTELETLKSQISGNQVDMVTQAEYDSLKAKYDALKSQYDALKSQYDTLTQEAVFTESDIDQAIFKLINEERAKAGAADLAWRNSLYTGSKQNSLMMAQNGEYTYTSGASQEVFWAIGYPTVDKIAAAALTTWKVNDYRYKHNILNSQNLYGAVGTYKSGDIYYITYMSTAIE